MDSYQPTRLAATRSGALLPVLSFTALLLVLFALSGESHAQPRSAAELADEAFAGLFVRDDADSGGCVVGWILPGPLGGTGFGSPYLNRGDLILEVNGESMNAAGFYQFVRESRPGDEVVLSVRRTAADQRTAVPRPGAGEEVREVRFTLGSRGDWAGPIAFVPADERPRSAEMIPDEPSELEEFVRGKMIDHEIIEPVDDLIAFFGRTLERNAGHHMLSRVAFGFHHPMRLPELQKTITDPLPAVARDPRLVLEQIALNLDLQPPDVEDGFDLSDPRIALAEAEERIARASKLVERAFRNVDPDVMEWLPGAMDELLDILSRGVYIMGHAEPEKLIRAMQATIEVDFQALLDGMAAISGFMVKSNPPPRDAPPISRDELPAHVREAVTGDVLAYVESNGRVLIYGGFGANTYNMSIIDLVIDPGGDDVYHYHDIAPNERKSVQVVVDMAGNDRHVARDASAFAAASASLGVSLLVDYAGNDRYEGHSRSGGVGALGIGILLDYDGNDVYSGTSWSQGAAFYGAGAVLDLGAGADSFTAEVMSQGIGGPRGFGLILSEGGRNLYRANGPIPSGYGTPAVYRSFSQGIGFGVRMYDSGGIGVLADLAGDDRYEGGEFSQGGGYYWGLGILYDKSGNDLYYGNRYSQGWAAHQALGILADDAGDDSYYGMTAASQGAAWDIGVGLLIDRAGNDSYQADGLSQGAAAQQAIGWLIDLGGVNRFIAPRGATHGRSGGDDYHYATSGCFSFSLLLSAGGEQDYYSTDRANGQTLATGSFNEGSPERSTLHGLFIDTEEPLTWSSPDAAP